MTSDDSVIGAQSNWNKQNKLAIENWKLEIKSWKHFSKTFTMVSEAC